MSKLDCNIQGIPQTSAGHAHAHAHILLPLTECLTLRLDGVDYAVTNRHLAFVAPEKFHHCFEAKDVIIMNIPASMIKESDLAILERCPYVPVTELLVPLVELIKTEVQRNPDSDSLRYLYYYLYDKLVERHSHKSVRYIHEHFGEEITVSKLAKLENYNITYFVDWFRKQTGYTPMQYIRNIRIEKAKELLATTHYRIVDIAIQVGYGSNAAFTKAFKEMDAQTPAQYRAHIRGERTGNVQMLFPTPPAHFSI